MFDRDKTPKSHRSKSWDGEGFFTYTHQICLFISAQSVHGMRFKYTIDCNLRLGAAMQIREAGLHVPVQVGSEPNGHVVVRLSNQDYPDVHITMEMQSRVKLGEDCFYSNIGKWLQVSSFLSFVAFHWCLDIST